MEVPISYRIENGSGPTIAARDGLAEERRKRDEEEEKRLQEDREQKQAEEFTQPRNPALMAMLVAHHNLAQQETDPDVKSYLMREVGL